MKCGLILFIIFALASCSASRFPTGKAKRMDMKDVGAGSFSPGKGLPSQAPQMGFYRERPRPRPVYSAVFRIRWSLADNRKRQVLGNSQMATTPQYGNEKLNEHLDKMSSSFVKGKLPGRKKANRANDSMRDSFAKDPNKDSRKGFFRRK